MFFWVKKNVLMFFWGKKMSSQLHLVAALDKIFHVQEPFMFDVPCHIMHLKELGLGCEQQVFCSDHKSLVVPWGPLSFSHGPLVHSPKTVHTTFILHGILHGIEEKVKNVEHFLCIFSHNSPPMRTTSHNPQSTATNYVPKHF